MFYKKITAVVLSFMMVFFNFLPNMQARKLTDDKVHNTGILGFGGSYDYKRNSDGNSDTVTLLKCKTKRQVDITSPVDGYKVTQIAANFSGGSQPSSLSAGERMKLFFKNAGAVTKGTAVGGVRILANILMALGEGASCVVANTGKAIANGFFIGTIMLMPIMNIFVMGMLANRSDGLDELRIFKWDEYRSFEPDYYAMPEINITRPQVYAKNIKSVDLRECNTVGENAFTNCKKLKKAILPLCKNIGDYAFANCESLSEINFEQCRNIGIGTFLNCKKLENVKLPFCGNVCYHAFAGCKNLKNVDLWGWDSSDVTLYGQCFENCEKLERVYAPTCKKIARGAFDGCNNLRELTISKDCKFAEGAIPEEKVKAGCVKMASSGTISLEQYRAATIKSDEDSEKFDAQDDKTDVRLQAEAGVFPKDAKLTVKKVMAKDMMDKKQYKEALKNLDDEHKNKIEKLYMYDIKVTDRNGNAIQPNGKVQVLFPINQDLDEKDLKALRISENKDCVFKHKIVEINGKKYFSYDTDHFSVYCLMDTFSSENAWDYLVPYVAGIATFSLLAWVIYHSMMKRKKLYVN